MRKIRAAAWGPLFMVAAVVCLVACGDGSGSGTAATPTATMTPSVTPSSVSATPSPSGDTRAWAAGDVIVRSNNGGLDWEVVRPAGEGFTSVAFADRTTGWAVARKTILHSTDGGDTWNDQTHTLDINIIRSLNAVTALSATRAVIVGGFDPIFAGSFGPVSIRLTTDAGATWPPGRITGSGTDKGELSTMCFTEAGIGFACGSTFGAGLCALSDDAGSNWIAIFGHGSAVACVGDAILWTIGPRGLFQSTDGGTTFLDRTATLPASFRGIGGAIAFATEMIGWFAGRDESGRPAVLRTRDGGDSWEAQALPGDASIGRLRAVEFADSLRGVAVGRQTNTAGEPTALGFATTDGGAVWQAARFPLDSPPLQSLAVVP